MRIAIYGGAFDPPTFGHKSIIQALLDFEIENKKHFSKIFIVPSGDNRLDKNIKAPYSKRLDMCYLMFSDIDEKILVYTAESEGFLDTVTLLSRLANNLVPETELYFVMGEDCIHNIESWQGYNEIISKYQFVIIRREIKKYNNSLPAKTTNNIFNGELDTNSHLLSDHPFFKSSKYIIINMSQPKYNNVSSTAIRYLLQNCWKNSLKTSKTLIKVYMDDYICNYISLKLFTYIYRNNLYK